MALAPVILALAFSRVILNAGGTRLLMGARLRLGAWAAPDVFLRGCFPPSSAVDFLVGVAARLLGVVPEVPGTASVAGAVNLALGILCAPVILFGVCFILAIYNTDAYLLTHQPATHNPTQYPTVYILPHPPLP